MTIDRRSFPRYKLEFPVKVFLDKEGDDAMKFKTCSVNVSRTSLELSCDNTFIDYLLTQKTFPRKCRLNFKLPDHPHNFDIESVVVTHRRLSQQHYYFVALLPEFDAEAEKNDVLGEYLSNL